MADDMRVMLEIGPKGKKAVAVAVAPDWPGLERGAKTGEAAIERLESYRPRYAKVARLAGMEAAFAAGGDVDVIQRYPGVGSPSFWGISFAFSDIDRRAMSHEAAELRKGPRGGGRNRDRIVRHTLGTEQDWAKKLGVLTPQGAMLTGEGLKARRAAYCTTPFESSMPKAKCPNLAAPVPDSAHRVSRAGPRLGNGR